MELIYTTLNGKTHKVSAKIRQGNRQPELILADGKELDPTSYFLLNYRIGRISKAEEPLMRRWLDFASLVLM